MKKYNYRTIKLIYFISLYFPFLFIQLTENKTLNHIFNCIDGKENKDVNKMCMKRQLKEKQLKNCSSW